MGGSSRWRRGGSCWRGRFILKGERFMLEGGEVHGGKFMMEEGRFMLKGGEAHGGGGEFHVGGWGGFKSLQILD